MSGTDICRRCECPAFLSCLACYHNLKQDSSFIRSRCSSPAWGLGVGGGLRYAEYMPIMTRCHSGCCYLSWRKACGGMWVPFTLKVSMKTLLIHIHSVAEMCHSSCFVHKQSFLTCWSASTWRGKHLFAVKCLKNATWMRQKQQ